MSDETRSDNHQQNLMLSEHERKNRALWQATSDSYQERHAASLSGKNA